MYVCVSTLELVDFRTLRVHVGVVQRVARGITVGRRQILRRFSTWRLHGCVILERVSVRVKTQIREFHGRVAALCGVFVAEILQVHKPLGPESPADALTVHGQVDKLAWKRQRPPVLLFNWFIKVSCRKTIKFIRKKYLMLSDSTPLILGIFLLLWSNYSEIWQKSFHCVLWKTILLQWSTD